MICRLGIPSAQRWMTAGCFEAMAHDLLRSSACQQEKRQPSAAVVDGGALQSSCESGPRAGYDGYKRRKGSKVHVTVDTLGDLLALKVTGVEIGRAWRQILRLEVMPVEALDLVPRGVVEHEDGTAAFHRWIFSAPVCRGTPGRSGCRTG